MRQLLYFWAQLLAVNLRVLLLRACTEVMGLTCKCVTSHPYFPFLTLVVQTSGSRSGGNAIPCSPPGVGVSHGRGVLCMLSVLLKVLLLLRFLTFVLLPVAALSFSLSLHTNLHLVLFPAVSSARSALLLCQLLLACCWLDVV